MPAQRLSQTIKRLEFDEKLVQTGKKETIDVLLKRLKVRSPSTLTRCADDLQTLHQKLAALEQDVTDVKSLEIIRKPLIHNTILHHKE